MNDSRCAPFTKAVAARCHDPLGDYNVVLCPVCGHSVPLQPHVKIGESTVVPSHPSRRVN